MLLGNDALRGSSEPASSIVSAGMGGSGQQKGGTTRLGVGTGAGVPDLRPCIDQFGVIYHLSDTTLFTEAAAAGKVYPRAARLSDRSFFLLRFCWRFSLVPAPWSRRGQGAPVAWRSG